MKQNSLFKYLQNKKSELSQIRSTPKKFTLAEKLGILVSNVEMPPGL